MEMGTGSTQVSSTHALRRHASSQELRGPVNQLFHQGVATDMRPSVDLEQSPHFPLNSIYEISLPSPTLCALSPQETAQMRFDVSEMPMPLKSSKPRVECLSSPYSTGNLDLSDASLGRDARVKNGKKRKPPITRKSSLALQIDENSSRNRTMRSENCQQRHPRAIAPYPQPVRDYRSEPLTPRLEEIEGSVPAEIYIAEHSQNSLFAQAGDTNGVDPSSLADLSTFLCSKEGTDIMATAMAKYYVPQPLSWTGDRFQSYDQLAASSALADEQTQMGLR